MESGSKLVGNADSGSVFYENGSATLKVRLKIYASPKDLYEEGLLHQRDGLHLAVHALYLSLKKVADC
jgi:hypothetical protein